MKPNRIWSVSFVKLIAAMLVLYIHVPFSTDLYLYQMPTRPAVPIFFCLSGFFWGGGKNRYEEDSSQCRTPADKIYFLGGYYLFV